MTDALPQGTVNLSGVVLRRIAAREGDLSLYLFLRSVGPVWVSAPGAARGRVRFGGASEPLVWGNFNLYKGPRRLYLKSVDVKEDFWLLRKQPIVLRRLLEWDRLLCRYLLPGHPSDEILALFYWSSLLLASGLPPPVGEWRFLWRWLHCEGLAPSLRECAACGDPLEDSRWTEGGLLCSKCGRTFPGGMLPGRARELLSLAASSPSSDVKALFCGNEVNERFWRSSAARILPLFESLR
ncbi:MAG: DNA repair protein RecO [Synergistaceae bacterium]|nr:DNA repair protein RecO [Synergistaceae bacterium]